MTVQMRIERRVERRDLPGYRYTAVVIADDGLYRAQIVGDRLRMAVLTTPVEGCAVRLHARRRTGRLLGPEGDVRARFRGWRELRVMAGTVRFDVGPEGGGFVIWVEDRRVGRIVAVPRPSPPADCFEAHGRRMIPLRDWSLTVDELPVPPEVWAALLVVVDDRRPTILLAASPSH